MPLPSTHRHVSERETAHRWPDGQWDDSRWEDCSWDSAIEFARAAKTSAIPATHTEAEHLRDDAGERPTGGSNIDDVRRGLARRYRWSTGYTVAYNFSQLWAALTKGKVAVVQGSMGAFPAGHRLRRWQPSYAGPHAVCAFRLDGTDNVWWCDPLAPYGVGYKGQWVTKADLKRFVDKLTSAGGRHLIAKYLVATYKVVIHPADGKTSRKFFVYTIQNGYIVDRKTVSTGGLSASCTAPRSYTNRDPSIGGAAYSLVKLTSGYRSGQYVDAKWASRTS